MAKITIFGLAGTGTSSVGKRLAEIMGYAFLSSGNIFHKKASNLGLSLEQFEELCATDPKYDKELDREIEEFGKKNDNFVIESRLAWHFIPDSIKIGLKCELEERVKRVALRDGLPEDEAKERVLQREAGDARRYQEVYGISDINDPGHFDLSLDTTLIPIEEVARRVEKFVEKKNPS